MNINKIKTYLGFAIKSKKIIFGFDNIISYKKNQILILVSSSVNNKTSLKINEFANRKNYKIINLTDLTCEELIGRDNCKMVSVIDENLAQAIIKEIEC